MKKFIKPLIEIVEIENDQIICTSEPSSGSGTIGGGGDDDIVID